MAIIASTSSSLGSVSRPCCLERGKRGVFLDGQLVDGQVFRFQPQGRLQRPPPAGHGLAGQAEHQVQVEVGETRPAACFDHRPHLGRAVRPAQSLQFGIGKGLHPDGQPVEAGPPQLAQLGFAHRGRIHLDGGLDLRRGPGKCSPAGVQESGQVGSGQDRRGAAAEKNGGKGLPRSSWLQPARLSAG